MAGLNKIILGGARQSPMLGGLPANLGSNIGDIRAFASNPGAPWLAMDGSYVAQSKYPGLLGNLKGIDGIGFSPTGQKTVSNTPRCAIGGPGVMIVAGENIVSGANLLYSQNDGAGWANAVLGSAGTVIYALGYGGGLYVAIGYADAYTSPDGANWTRRAGVFSNWTMTCITYGNGMFVATGVDGNNNACVATSTDGAGWNLTRGPATSNSWASVGFVNGLFLIPGISTSYYYTASNPSLGASAWTQRTAPDSTVGSSYLAVGQGLRSIGVAFSNGPRFTADGLNWSTSPSVSDYLFIPLSNQFVIKNTSYQLYYLYPNATVNAAYGLCYNPSSGAISVPCYASGVNGIGKIVTDQFKLTYLDAYTNPAYIKAA